ncbi:MAG: hypothetical protein IJ584_09645, partial [Bacteroidales bacterium]|nr:hypothetical protein [Bacteroidales bacterium]
AYKCSEKSGNMLQGVNLKTFKGHFRGNGDFSTTTMSIILVSLFVEDADGRIIHLQTGAFVITPFV